jgi:hypothetical protein
MSQNDFSSFRSMQEKQIQMVFASRSALRLFGATPAISNRGPRKETPMMLYIVRKCMGIFPIGKIDEN